MWAVVGNAVLLLLVGITYIFCLGNIKSALYSDTYQPVVQVFYNATGSKAGTSVMIVVVCIVLLSACIGQVATASRQMFSFARDRGIPTPSAVHNSGYTDFTKGFPFSHFLEYVPPGYNIPVPAIIVSTIITSLLSLINIGAF
jgi:amino acid transporter